MSNCIYRITNIINNKSYIGSTNNFERRMREHKIYVNCSSNRKGYNYPLYRSFRKYGLQNFKFEILIDNISTLEEARKIEEQLIKKYNCLTPNGYNLKESTEGLSEKDIQKLIEKTGIKCALIDENENIIKIYSSLREAARENNTSGTSVAKVCKGLQYKTKNKKFRYIDENQSIIEIEPKYSLRYSGICGVSIFDEDDIVYYDTIKDAAETEEISKVCIAKCIKGNSGYKQSNNRIWRKIENGIIIENNFVVSDLIEYYCSKYIYYNEEYKTLTEWANSIGLSGNGLKARLKTMSMEEAMTKPVKANSRRFTGKRINGR